MADIFLSYNENDRDTVRRLAATLQAVGWSVWWDRRIPAGGTWRQLLERELASMRCMVVVWSAHSIKSEWVCEEATEGRQLGCLVPVCIERVKPPAGFREIQAADLVGWDGTATFLGMRTLIDDIQLRIGAPTAGATGAPPVTPHPPDPAVSVRRRRAWVLAGSPIAALVAIALFVGPLRPDSSPSADTAQSASMPDRAIAQPASLTSGEVHGAGGPVRPSDRPGPTPVSPAPIASTGGDRPNTAKPTIDTSATKARCVNLTERVSLGDALTSDENSYLRRQCGK